MVPPTETAREEATRKQGADQLAGGAAQRQTHMHEDETETRRARRVHLALVVTGVRCV